MHPLLVEPPSSTEAPRFPTPLHVGRPNLGNRQSFLERVEDILDRRWLSNGGKYVQEFEQKVADQLQVKHCVAMCNATSGLEIATRALELHGEVIVPSFTFVATAHCLQWQQITPIFCDIDPDTHNIDPGKVERLITPRTTGILAVHLWGRGCNIDALEKICAKYGLKLLFDASHAFGCSHQGQMIGGFGHVEVFSFHATKFINCLEGGVVSTNNDDLAHKMRMMKNFGFTNYDQVEYLGVNGKMNEISAAMGITNLESMSTFVDINRRNFECYQKGLAGLPGISLITYDPSERSNYQYVVAEIDPQRSSFTRDQLVSLLHKNNVLARKYFWPGCHKMEPYRSLQPNANLLLSETERVASRVMVLPTGQSMEPEYISQICSIIARAVAHNSPDRSSKGSEDF